MRTTIGVGIRERTEIGWVYLAATALLQPISEEFLYRAPDDRAAHTLRLRRVARTARPVAPR